MLNRAMQIERHVAGSKERPRPGALAIVSSTIAPEGDASFSALEWLVIATAARSSERSLGSTRLALLLRALHGRDALEPSAPLAALASLAAHSARFGWSTAPCEMAAFLRAGWSDAQLELLIDTVEADGSALSAVAHR